MFDFHFSIDVNKMFYNQIFSIHNESCDKESDESRLCWIVHNLLDE